MISDFCIVSSTGSTPRSECMKAKKLTTMNEKTLVFDNGGAMDGNLVAALMNGNNRNGNGYGNGWEWMWMILLWALWGGNGWGGFGGRGGLSGLPAQLNGDAGREMLMNAIQGNGTAIAQLASSLNCSVQQIQTALCNIQAQSGLSAQQIINAVQSGNSQLLAQLASCCCDVKQAIGGVNVGLERGFSSIAFETQRQTCDLQNTIRETSQSGTTAVIAKLDQMQTAALQDKIDALREKNSTLTTQLNLEHQNAYMAGVVGQAVAPVNAAVAALQSEVNDIKCKLPETATIPYSPVVGVPTCLAAQYGFAAAGLGYGLGYGNGGFWG